ncbi:MAG TPA: DUF86 domain-containing protein [Thermoanaerobaculia bacterium]|nr:DUF86 domain-containing protein [Thermoanaerobaculia bacterium]
MTDRELVAKKLALIETCVHDLRTLARPEEMKQDVREERFIEHTLQIAIQAALDVAAHIVADESLGEPRTNRDLFDLLERHGWLSGELANELRQMVGFRNVLVHGYGDVDLEIVEEIVRHHVGDLLRFVAAIRGKV